LGTLPGHPYLLTGILSVAYRLADRVQTIVAAVPDTRRCNYPVTDDI
jgi:hypothetical protein